MSELYVLLTFAVIIFVTKTKFYKVRPRKIRVMTDNFISGLAAIADGLVSVLTLGYYVSNSQGAWHRSKIHQDLLTYELGKNRGVFNGSQGKTDN